MRKTRTKTPETRSRMKGMLLLLPVFIPLMVMGQYQDDFSDGDFTHDPAWSGDTAVFTITSSSAVPPLQAPALKLNGLQEDTSFLAVQSTLAAEAEWRFWIKLSFNTSASNHARFYLTSDQPELDGPLNGYFVRVGGSDDSIGLYRQSGNEILHLVKGAHAYTGNSTNVMRIKVTRDGAGHWDLYSDPLGGYAFLPEGSCLDAEFQSSSFSGIYCRYTVSNATKFYFDDLYAGGLFADTIPPNVTELLVSGPGTLVVAFSEMPEPVTALDPLNYSVDGGIGHPEGLMPDPSAPSSVELFFDTTFSAGFPYLLEVANVMDPAGNPMVPQVIPFTYLPPAPLQPGELLINELMADVNPPPAGLPEADYVELYNPGPAELNLEGVSIQPKASSPPLSLPDVVIPAGGYLLVVQPGDVALFEDYGPVAGLGGFALNNEGSVILRNQFGGTVHAITYGEDTYKDPQKEMGGWSLELTDTGNTCAGGQAWQAAMAGAGGTPGSANSAQDEVISAPAISALALLNENTLEVRFTHHMDSAVLANPYLFDAGPGFGPPVSVSVSSPFFDAAKLTFESAFPVDGEFALTLTDTLRDFCGGTIPPGGDYFFVHPGAAGPWDIVISEVMADPDPPAGLPGHEYIELFNVTDRYLLLEGWTLSIGGTQYPVPPVTVSPYEFLILAGEEEALILNVFGRTLLVEGLLIPNSQGTIMLLDPAGCLMCACAYDQDLFPDPAQASGGYSLELADPYNPCGIAGNWLPTQAAAGGTPGAVNSVDGPFEPAPAIASAIIEDDSLLLVVFDMFMDGNLLIEQAKYLVDNGMGVPLHAVPADVTATQVRLTFDRPFKPGIHYHLTFSGPAVNCIGLTYPQPPEFTFGLAEMAEAGDLVINEVLFNPAGDGVDFVEVVNRSDKIIDLDEIMLGTVRPDVLGGVDTLLYAVSDRDRLLLAGGLVVLTSDPARVQEQYICGAQPDFIAMEAFPAYTNEAGTVLLAVRSGPVIDRFDYEEGMHHPLLHNVDGVSLERLHPDRPSGDRTNWHSASSGSGFATPALVNSQYCESREKPFELWVHPAIFSPDNDGIDDVATIGYAFDSPGFMASIIIFDGQGRPVRYLVNNALLGTEGAFSWDGITDDRQKAGIGIYVVYFEAFDREGVMVRNKVALVLAGRLE